MSRVVEVTPEYASLIEECQAIVAETRFDVAIKDIEWRHQLGEAICKNPLYAKYGRSGLVQRIARDIGLGKTIVYETIDFYEKFPQLRKFLDSHKPEQKGLRWSR